MTSRSLHRRIALPIFLLLAITALTGVTYRVGKAWFGIDGQTGQSIMEIHSGEWLGSTVSIFYVLLVGLCTLAILATGAFLLVRSRSPQPRRRAHRILGLLLLLPLLASAITGIFYKIGTTWLTFPEEVNDTLMIIHEGGWLGHTGKVYYILIYGLGLLAVGVIGLALLVPKKRH